MYETARLPVDIAIKARMEMHGVGREKTCYWNQSASEVVDWASATFPVCKRATYDQAGWRFAGDTFSSFWMVICL